MPFRGQIAVPHALLGVALLSSGLCAAQTAPAQGSGTVKTSIRAVGYQLGTTSKIDLKSSSLAPNAAGEATVEAKQGVTRIEAAVAGLVEPTKLGAAEFLTYVVWVVSPEGRASNIGEIQLLTVQARGN